MEFFKFPKTPHLFLLKGVEIRDDKVMDEEESGKFLERPVIVEEKLDGANLGISFNDYGEIQFQNRGNYIRFDSHPQFGPLKSWTRERLSLLENTIGRRFIFFGEWCYAKHSIHYTHLPDWFLGFDVYDRELGKFLTVERRNDLFRACRIVSAPHVFQGTLTRGKLKEMVNTNSAFYPGPLEGLYLRTEEGGFLRQRAKLVRAEFIQSVQTHWTKERMVLNELA